MLLMRISLLLLLIPLSALAGILPQLPPSDTPVTEVSACHPLGQNWTNLRKLEFRLEFVGTASNDVEVAFGRDLDGNGALESHETRLLIGWECGRYFVENFKTGARYEAVGATNNTARVLDWSYVLKGDERLLRAFFATAESNAAFAELTAEPPGWIYDRDWDMMRLVARGTDIQNERFSVKTTRSATTIILR